jgi:hypothetical protein
VVAVGLVFGLGAWDFLRRRPLEFWLFSTPVAVTIAGALMARGTMYPRFFFFLIGFLVLFLVRGAMITGSLAARAVRRAAWGERAGTTFVVVPILTSLGALVVGYYPHPKQGYAEAVAFADGRVDAGERVVAAGSGAWPVFGYFERPFRWIGSAAELDEERSHGDPVWILFTFPRYLENEQPEIMRAIDEECMDTRRFPGTVGDGDLVVCALPPLSAG